MMLCKYFRRADASHCRIHVIKTIGPLNVRKGKQDLCPQINADEHRYLETKNAFIRVHLRLSVDVVFLLLMNCVH